MPQAIPVYPLFALLLAGLTIFGLVRAITGRRTALPAIIGTLAWLAAVLFMTIRPGNGRGVRLNLTPILLDGPGSAIDAVLNLLVFVPPGLLLATAGWKLYVVLAAALAVTLAIEITQYLTDLGRTADVNDLITNTLGAGLGWLIGWLLAGRAARRSQAYRDPTHAP